MFYHNIRREREFVYHKRVPIEEYKRSWIFLTVEERC